MNITSRILIKSFLLCIAASLVGLALEIAYKYKSPDGATVIEGTLCTPLQSGDNLPRKHVDIEIQPYCVQDGILGFTESDCVKLAEQKLAHDEATRMQSAIINTISTQRFSHLPNKFSQSNDAISQLFSWIPTAYAAGQLTECAFVRALNPDMCFINNPERLHKFRDILPDECMPEDVVHSNIHHALWNQLCESLIQRFPDCEQRLRKQYDEFSIGEKVRTGALKHYAPNSHIPRRNIEDVLRKIEHRKIAQQNEAHAAQYTLAEREADSHAMHEASGERFVDNNYQYYDECKHFLSTQDIVARNSILARLHDKIDQMNRFALWWYSDYVESVHRLAQEFVPLQQHGSFEHIETAQTIQLVAETIEQQKHDSLDRLAQRRELLEQISTGNAIISGKSYEIADNMHAQLCADGYKIEKKFTLYGHQLHHGLMREFIDGINQHALLDKPAEEYGKLLHDTATDFFVAGRNAIVIGDSLGGAQGIDLGYAFSRYTCAIVKGLATGTAETTVAMLLAPFYIAYDPVGAAQAIGEGINQTTKTIASYIPAPPDEYTVDFLDEWALYERQLEQVGQNFSDLKKEIQQDPVAATEKVSHWVGSTFISPMIAGHVTKFLGKQTGCVVRDLKQYGKVCTTYLKSSLSTLKNGIEKLKNYLASQPHAKPGCISVDMLLLGMPGCNKTCTEIGKELMTSIAQQLGLPTNVMENAFETFANSTIEANWQVFNTAVQRYLNKIKGSGEVVNELVKNCAQGSLGRAKGPFNQLRCALKLEELGHKIQWFEQKINDIPHDILTNKWLVECKNVHWEAYIKLSLCDRKVERLIKQLSTLAEHAKDLKAEGLNVKPVFMTKYAIPAELTWLLEALAKNNIEIFVG